MAIHHGKYLWFNYLPCFYGCLHVAKSIAFFQQKETPLDSPQELIGRLPSGFSRLSRFVLVVNAQGFGDWGCVPVFDTLLKLHVSLRISPKTDATTPARARPAPAAHAGEFFPREKRRGAQGAQGGARGRRALRLSLGPGRQRQDASPARFFRGGGGRGTRSRRGRRRRPSRCSGAD